MFLREHCSKKRKQSKVLLAILGVLSGILCGLYGVGVLLGAYVSSKVLDGKIVKKAVIVMLVVSGVTLIINNI